MIDRQRIAALAFALVAAGAVTFPATAAADDPPADPALLPADSPPPPPPPTVPMLGQLGPAGIDVLAQSNAPGLSGTLGAPPTVGLNGYTVLGQNPDPSAPGAGTGTPPNLNVFNNAYGPAALNDVPSAPGQGQQFGVAPGEENADVRKGIWFGRWIDLQRAGKTWGGLGQRPEEQLGQPLPGTAPPPGTVIPAGPVQLLPDPADGPAPPPGLILPPPVPEAG